MQQEEHETESGPRRRIPNPSVEGGWLTGTEKAPNSRGAEAAGVTRVRIDVCHAAIVPALLALHGAGGDLDVEALYGLLRSKDAPGLDEWLRNAPAPLRGWLPTLLQLHGRVGDALAADSPLARARVWRR